MNAQGIKHIDNRKERKQVKSALYTPGGRMFPPSVKNED